MKAPLVKKIGKYVVLEEVGSGGFSTVYRCKHEETGSVCAVKIGNTSVAGEYREKRKQVDTMMHMEEWAAYGTLKYGRGEAHKCGIPAVYETGLVKMSEREIYPYLVMQLLGRHIGRELSQPTFTKKRFYQIAQQMLAALQYMHEAGLVHRDVKPSNFCIGRREELSVFILDMGFACKRAGPDDDEKSDFVGTPDYSSGNALHGRRQGPNDDLESLGYSLLEMWLGDLPWYLTTNESAEGGWTSEALVRMSKTRDRKWRKLVAAGDIPTFLVKWIDYCKALHALQMPSYGYLQNLLAVECATLSGSKRKSDERVSIEALAASPCKKKIKGMEPEE